MIIRTKMIDFVNILFNFSHKLIFQLFYKYINQKDTFDTINSVGK